MPAVPRSTLNPDSTLALTRRLIALRRSRPALQTGTQRRIADAPDDLIVFERGAGEDRLLCVFNPTGRGVDWTCGPGWSRIESVNDDSGSTLAPYAARILCREGSTSPA